MNITRTLKQNQFSVASIVRPEKTYELNASEGVIRLKEYNGRRSGFDALVMPSLLGTILLPADISRRAGFGKRQTVYIFPKDDAYYILSPDATPGNVTAVNKAHWKFAYRRPISVIAKKAEAADVRSLKAERWHVNVRSLMDELQEGARSVICSLFVDGTYSWMELRPDDLSYENLFTSSQIADMFRIPFVESLSGLTFRVPLKGGSFLIPRLFRDSEMDGGDAFPAWVSKKDKCIVIEKPIKACSICGKPMRSTVDHRGTVTVCGSLQKDLGPDGKVHALVQAEQAYTKAKKILSAKR